MADDYVWQLPAGLKPPPVPAENPMSTAKVELGAALFGDGRLSVTGAYSCASCHMPALAFTDGRKTAVGATGELHTRNTPTLLNCAYASSFGWADPSVTTLEAQHRVPMDNHHPVELGLDQVLPERLAELNADRHVSALQHAAFGAANAALDLDQVIQALASYVRTLIAADTAFDRYLYWGEALPASAQRGMRLFFSERVNCVLCHASFNLSGPTRQQGTPAARPVFHNTGLYNLDGSGAYPDSGLMTHTGKPTDMGAFRAPTLRNVAVTAPYMHDGSMATLPEVIDFYAAGGRNIESGPFAGDGRQSPFKRKEIRALDLSPQDKSDLVAFLESLTDARYRQTQEGRSTRRFAQRIVDDERAAVRKRANRMARVGKHDTHNARSSDLRDTVNRDFEFTVDDLPDLFLFVRDTKKGNTGARHQKGKAPKKATPVPRQHRCQAPKRQKGNESGSGDWHLPGVDAGALFPGARRRGR